MQLSLWGCELLLLNLQGAETAVDSFRMQSSLEFLLRTHGEAEHDWTQTQERASQVALVAENPLAKAGDAGSLPGPGGSPGGGHGNPLQRSCLENPTDRGAWGAAVHGVAQSQTRLSE